MQDLLIRQRKLQNHIIVKLLHGGLPAVGRNNGAKIAEGELLLFLDSDVVLSADYLESAIEEFEEKN